jgi:hypothetical protein
VPDTIKESWTRGHIKFKITVFDIGIAVALLDVTPLAKLFRHSLALLPPQLLLTFLSRSNLGLYREPLELFTKALDLFVPCHEVG